MSKKTTKLISEIILILIIIKNYDIFNRNLYQFTEKNKEDYNILA